MFMFYMYIPIEQGPFWEWDPAVSLAGLKDYSIYKSDMLSYRHYLGSQGLGHGEVYSLWLAGGRMRLSCAP